MHAIRATWPFVRSALVALLAPWLAPAQSPAVEAEEEPKALVARLATEDTPELRRRIARLGPAAVDALHTGSASEEPAHRIRCLEVLASLGLRAGDTSDELLKTHGGVCSTGAEFVAMLEAVAAVLPLHEGFRKARIEMGEPEKLAMPDGIRSWFTISTRGGVPAELLPRLRAVQGRMELRCMFVVGADSSLDALRAALEHEYPLIRELAAELLALRGSDAAPVADALLRALDATHEPPSPILDVDQTRIVRRAVALALIAIAPGEPPSAAGHAWFLAHGDAHDRATSVSAIRMLGADAAPAVPALIEVLDAPQTHLVAEAILALAGLGEAATPALPRLRELRDHDDAAIARPARAAIASIAR